MIKLDEYYKWAKTDNSIAYQFELNGGLDALEEAQKHPNKRVYDFSSHILCTYFEVDQMNDGEMDGCNQDSHGNTAGGFNI